jgi:hypothetical protein
MRQISATNFWFFSCLTRRLGGCRFLYSHFFGNIIASQAAGANFYGESRAFHFGFYLDKVGFPDPPGTIFGVAYPVTSHRMFSANFAGSRHSIHP